MDRASRFIWELDCGKKDRKLFQKAIKSLDSIARQTHDLSLFTDGERRYGNRLFEICHELGHNGKPGRPKARTSCDSSNHCRDGYPCQSCRSVLECPAPKMCHLSTKDQYICQSNHGIAEAVTGVLGGAQFPSGSLYHPRSSCSRFRPTRNADICAGNFSDSNGISDDCKRQKRSHQTEPVPPLHLERIFHTVYWYLMKE